MKRLAAITFLLTTCLIFSGCGAEESTERQPKGQENDSTSVAEGDTDATTDNGDSGTQGETGSDGQNQESIDNDKVPRVAYVTNGVASFWVIAEAGARKAGEDFNAEVEVRMPVNGVDDQKRMIEELLVTGIDGVAVSPIDPDNQQSLLNDVASKTNLITHDSDAEGTDRLCYIGMSNYDAGRMCGELVKEAIPDGGEVMIFVGRLEQLNARLRRQGVIDELMDRSYDPERYDDPDAVVEGDKYTIVGTRTDGFDFIEAKSQAEDAITAYPNMKCMVGLFAYNPPLMLEALKGAGKVGEIALVGFDEEDGTLQAIKDGECYGTVVQNPYEYGYQSVKMLAALSRGDMNAIPKGEFMDIPARKITKDNVEEFWANLKQLLEGNRADDGDADAGDSETTDGGT